MNKEKLIEWITKRHKQLMGQIDNPKHETSGKLSILDEILTAVESGFFDKEVTG